MQHWEEKISAIEQKIYTLVEINSQYKQLCDKLRLTNEQLEQENLTLRQQLLAAQQNPPAIAADQPPTPSLQEAKANISAPNDNDFAQEKEFIKKQINQYIRDIDATISWIQSLAAPNL